MRPAYRLAGGAALALVAGPASAEITVSGARIAEGSLIVVGQADEPNARITLDGGFDQNTDGKGRFEFRLVYHPATCIVILKTPKAERSAVVTGCGQVGPRGEAGPPGPPGSRTAESAEALPARSPVVRQQEAIAVQTPAPAIQQAAPPAEPVRPPTVEPLRPRPAPPTTAALPLAPPAAPSAEPVRPPAVDPLRPRPTTTTTTTTTAALPLAPPAAPSAEPVRPPAVDPLRPRPGTTTTTTTTTAALPSAPPLAPTIPALGEWFVEDGTAKIAIQPCGPNLCGNVSWSKAGGELGTQILRSMKQTGPNRWEGTIHDPTTGRNYQSNISLRTQDSLRVEGCVLGFLCGGQTWTRVK